MIYLLNFYLSVFISNNFKKSKIDNENLLFKIVNFGFSPTHFKGSYKSFNHCSFSDENSKKRKLWLENCHPKWYLIWITFVHAYIKLLTSSHWIYYLCGIDQNISYMELLCERNVFTIIYLHGKPESTYYGYKTLLHDVISCLYLLKNVSKRPKKKKQTALKFVENHYLIVIDMWYGLPTVYLSYQNEGTKGFLIFWFVTLIN